MSHLVFIIIGFAWVVITRPLYRKNIELFLVSLIPINYNFFHLLPRIGSHDNYPESLLVVVLFYFVEVCLLPRALKIESEIRPATQRYNGIIYFFFAVVLYGCIVALVQGQDIISTIKAAKPYPLLLMYFIVMHKDIDIGKFCKYFILLALCLAILVLIQYGTFGKISLFHFYADATTHLRKGSYRGVRIIEGSILISLVVLFSVTHLLRRFSRKYIIFASVSMVELFIAVKTRTEIFGLLLSILIISFMYFKASLTKIMAFTYIILFLITVSLQFGIIQSYISKQGIVNKTIVDIVGMSSLASHGNLSIRKQCFSYYFDDVLQNKGLGRGLLSDNWGGSTELYEKNVLGFYFSDIGVMHMIVFFGLPGAVFVLYCLSCFVGDFFSPLLFDCPEVMSFFVFGMTILPFTDIFFVPRNFFLFALFLALLSKIHSHAYS